MNKQQTLQVLFQRDNFDPEIFSSVLDETVNSLGSWINFVPKYHPKLKFIEMYWGYLKRKVGNEGNYTWNTFLEQVPEALYYVPLKFMCGSFTKCRMYIDECSVVLTPTQVEFSSKK